VLFSIFSLGHVLWHAPFILKLKDLHFIPLSSTNRRCCKNEFCNSSIIRSFFTSTSVLIAYLRLYPPLVWQMWQQKNATYWGTRARTRALCWYAQENQNGISFPIPLVAPFRAVGCTTSIHTKITSFCNTELSNSTTTEIFLSLFCDFFPLLGNIPHIPIGAHDGGAHHYPFSFTAKATPTYTQTLLTTVPPQSTRTTFPNDRAHNPPLSNAKVALLPTYNHDLGLPPIGH